MRTWKHVSRLAALGAALALAVAACSSDGGSDQGGSDEGPIVIGADISSTGFTSTYDQANRTGLLLGVDDINKQGGILGRQVEVKFSADNQAKPPTSGSLAVGLIQEGADVGVTSCDYDVGGPASVQFQTKNILSISVCASAINYGPAGGLQLGFSAGDSAAGYAAAIAEYGYKTKGWRTAYTLLDNTIAYTQEMCDSFGRRWESLGGTIAGRDTYSQGDPSIQLQISKIKALPKPPDAIRLCTYLPGLASAVKQIRAAGVTAPILAGSEADGTFWHEGIPNLTNFFYTGKGSIFGDDSNPKLNDFYKRLEAHSGKKPTDGIAVGGYMIVEMIKIAAEKVGSLDGAKMAAVLQGFKDQELLLGPTTFTDKFHVAVCRPPAIMEASAPNTVKFVTRHEQEVVPLPKAVGGGDHTC